MKSLYLIFNNLKNLVKHNSATFIIVSISLISSTFGILFYAGYLVESYYERLGKNVDSVEINLNKVLSINEINTILSSLHFIDCDFEKIFVAESNKNPSSNKLSLVGEYDKSYKTRILTGDYYDYSSNAPVIILPEYLVGSITGYNKNPIGQELTIQGEKFKVFGIVSFMEHDHYAVPVSYYINNCPVKYIQFTYSDRLSKADIHSINEVISNYSIHDYKINIQKPPYLSLKFWAEFLQILFIFSFIIINIFTIIYFWARQSRRTYNIYSVCGGNNFRISCLFVTQTFIILIISSSIGYGIFTSVQDYLASIGIVSSNHYFFYFIIYSIVLAVTFIFTIITIVIANSNNIVYYIKE